MKKAFLLLMLLFAVAALAACGKGSGQADGNSPPAEPDTQAAGAPAGNAAEDKPAAPETETVPEMESEPETITVRYYVTDAELGELIEKQTEVTVGEGGNVYKAALEALQKETEKELSLWKGVEFKDAVLKEGVLTVDVSIPDEARLGAPGEALALEAITRTAFQFDEVKALDILVDGEAVESLMGHVELEHPIQRG
ncbi:MAG TPA: GerMN domain-containing protein [Paenibacillus sp.]|uniref:GerMN domain-containing protein n=1 Tax=Paenibacillus sp. TaxID=58172 RepID=UPI0028D4665A|nr:GerMN domain-containing protein [Paenibacillus sp.]HUC90688.1 GerMN domain-containing protein [Paenibacillus sp.]